MWYDITHSIPEMNHEDHIQSVHKYTYDSSIHVAVLQQAAAPPSWGFTGAVVLGARGSMY